MMGVVVRLVTIPISHFCEKARWALARAGVPYREERHVQGIHMLAARRAGGGSTVPVLVTDDGVLGESAEILAWADERTPAPERLYPADPGQRAEVDALSRRFDERLGPSGRRLLYVHMLANRELMLRFNNQGVPAWEDRAIRAGWPLAVRFAGARLGIRPGVEVGDEAAVWREFDAAAELLSDGRPYLCGDRFTAADLTFAALSSPVTVPPEYGVTLPRPDEMPPETRRSSSAPGPIPRGATRSRCTRHVPRRRPEAASASASSSHSARSRPIAPLGVRARRAGAAARGPGWRSGASSTTGCPSAPHPLAFYGLLSLIPILLISGHRDPPLRRRGLGRRRAELGARGGRVVLGLRGAPGHGRRRRAPPPPPAPGARARSALLTLLYGASKVFTDAGRALDQIHGERRVGDPCASASATSGGRWSSSSAACSSSRSSRSPAPSCMRWRGSSGWATSTPGGGTSPAGR